MRISEEFKNPAVEVGYEFIGNIEGLNLYFIKRMIKIDGINSGKCDLCVGVRVNNGELYLRKPTSEEDGIISSYIERNRSR